MISKRKVACTICLFLFFIWNSYYLRGSGGSGGLLYCQMPDNIFLSLRKKNWEDSVQRHSKYSCMLEMTWNDVVKYDTNFTLISFFKCFFLLQRGCMIWKSVRKIFIYISKYGFSKWYIPIVICSTIIS